jgi:hypothetical protein
MWSKTMTTSPYEMLDGDSKRYFRRRAYSMYAVMIAGLLSYVGLLTYMCFTWELNWIVAVWFLATALGMRLGARTINKQLEQLAVEKGVDLGLKHRKLEIT